MNTVILPMPVRFMSTPSVSRAWSSKLHVTGSRPRLTSLKTFHVIKTLGQGGSADVYLARDKKTGELSALKVIPKATLDPGDARFTLMEQKVLRELRGSEHILRLDASFHDSKNFYLITPFYPGGDLATLLQHQKHFSLRTVTRYAAELLLAIEILHKKKIIHRDIKPGNVLIDNHGHLVLADFGLAREFTEDSALSEPRPDLHGFGRPYTTSSCLGTPEYASPELLACKPYSFEVDLWAFGVMLYEFLTGRDAFVATVSPDDPTWVDNLSAHVRCDPLVFHPSDDIDPITQDFLNKVLAKKREKRLTIPQMKAHRFFTFIDWNVVCGQAKPGPWVPPPVAVTPTVESPLSIAFRSFRHQKDEEMVSAGRLFKPEEDPFPTFTFDPSTPNTPASTDTHEIRQHNKHDKNTTHLSSSTPAAESNSVKRHVLTRNWMSEVLVPTQLVRGVKSVARNASL
ncbi:kinase-like protein [Artomyces pyxidatus]|uniref:Kinase-like protein n=1 Tax=Artomyces pyxidatus TaxID=48021 RepID=A0ACB8TLM5_9AGAM|nr:kinase-like protein [Artomyces pyxidatus]